MEVWDPRGLKGPCQPVLEHGRLCSRVMACCLLHRAREAEGRETAWGTWRDGVKACSRTCVCSRRLAAAWHTDPQCNVCDWLGGIGERVVPDLARALDAMSLDAGGPVTDRLLDTAPLRQSVLSALVHSTAPAPTWGTCIDHSLLLR